jgi:hypothetical protein
MRPAAAAGGWALGGGAVPPESVSACLVML